MDISNIIIIVTALTLPLAFLHGWIVGRADGVIVGASLAFDTIIQHGVEQEEKGLYLVKLMDDSE